MPVSLVSARWPLLKGLFLMELFQWDHEQLVQWVSPGVSRLWNLDREVCFYLASLLAGSAPDAFSEVVDRAQGDRSEVRSTQELDDVIRENQEQSRIVQTNSGQRVAGAIDEIQEEVARGSSVVARQVLMSMVREASAEMGFFGLQLRLHGRGFHSEFVCMVVAQEFLTPHLPE